MPHNQLKSGDSLPKVVWILPAIMLVVAVMPLPYGYYTLLRIVVSIAAGLVAFSVYSKSQSVSVWVAVFGLLALLFNPIIPVHLDRELWFIIDLGAAATFLTYGILSREREPGPD